MTLANARLWFRFRCQIIDHIKGNKSSVWRNNMACRLCTSGEDENPRPPRKVQLHKGNEGKSKPTIREDKIVGDG